MRLGVLDIGSNSIHLLVADVTREGRISVVADTKEMVRLGTALGRRTISPESFQAGLCAVEALRARARTVECPRVVAVATSVIRETDNGPAFLQALDPSLDARILRGEEEARFVYGGVRSARPSGTIAVLDVGGGSVEVAVGRGERPDLLRSLPLGVLRLRERHLGTDGVLGRRHVAALTDAVRREATEVAGEVHALSPEAFVLTAGTPRALARLATGLPGVRSEDVLGVHVVFRLAAALVGRAPASLAALGVEPGRRDTIAVGAVVVASLLAIVGASEAIVEKRGLREGVLLHEARRRGLATPTRRETTDRAGP